MSVLGVGTDLVEIARIAAALQRYGNRFPQRVLAGDELRQWRQGAPDAAYLARRFAAKEALAKALGCGIGGELSFQDVIIGHDGRGAPRVLLSGAGQARAARLGVRHFHLSITDERAYALAFVVAES